MQDIASAPQALSDVARVHWTLGDIGRALIVPGIFLALNVVAGLAFSEGNEPHSPAATLRGAISQSDTTLVYESSGDPIEAGTEIQIEDERVRATVVDAGRNTIAVERGVRGTSAAAHDAGRELLAAAKRSSEGELISTLTISMFFQLFLLGLVWSFTVRKYKVSWRELGLRRPLRGGWFFPLAVVMGAFIIVYTWVGLLLALGIEGDSDLPEGTFDYSSTIILLGLLSRVLAPFVEELFFRGFLFGGLRSRSGMWPMQGRPIRSLFFPP
jgi:hypothetical protein